MLVCAPDSPLRGVLARLEAVARFDSTVLLLGPTGAGKELCARHVHTSSPRRSAPFVALNCGAIPPGLLESELFGHEKGSFTGAHEKRAGRFEAAHGGTLLLDEIGELPLSAQAALLRVLQERRVVRVGGVEEIAVDVRLVAATHRDLDEMAQAGTFRWDLLHRIRVVDVRLPSLAERPMDLVLLWDHLGRKVAQRLRTTPPPPIEATCLRLMRLHTWPGNVRELENLVERTLAFAPLGIRLEDLLGDLLAAPLPSVEARSTLTSDEGAARELRQLLALHQGHRGRTAAALGISRRALTYRLERLGLTRSPKTGCRLPS